MKTMRKTKRKNMATLSFSSLPVGAIQPSSNRAPFSSSLLDVLSCEKIKKEKRKKKIAMVAHPRHALVEHKGTAVISISSTH
jgi:hypothetical protein